MRYYLKGEVIRGTKIQEDGMYYVDDEKVVKVPDCTKKSWGSKIEAELALETIRQRGIVMYKTPIRCYKCPICRRWHLTSSRKREYKPKK